MVYAQAFLFAASITNRQSVNCVALKLIHVRKQAY